METVAGLAAFGLAAYVITRAREPQVHTGKHHQHGILMTDRRVRRHRDKVNSDDLRHGQTVNDVLNAHDFVTTHRRETELARRLADKHSSVVGRGTNRLHVDPLHHTIYGHPITTEASLRRS